MVGTGKVNVSCLVSVLPRSKQFLLEVFEYFRINPPREGVQAWEGYLIVHITPFDKRMNQETKR